MTGAAFAGRQTICERCGVAFGCTLDGPCWCGEEAVKLPLPKPGESRYGDCLCRACLRDVAAEAAIPTGVYGKAD